jgi:cytidylate kinase
VGCRKNIGEQEIRNSGDIESLSTPLIIAIDGPVASGKTTVGKILAKRLGYRFLDTGLMYRAVAWSALQRQMDPSDEEVIGVLAHSLLIEVVFDPRDTISKVMVDGSDVTSVLASPEVEQIVSIVARITEVRKAMVTSQQRIAAGGQIVMVGRDIGTKVVPRASVKIYMWASLRERSRRRYEELKSTRITTLKEVRHNLEIRDKLDSERSDSPLKPAEDALLLRTGGLSVDDVVQKIVDLFIEVP